LPTAQVRALYSSQQELVNRTGLGPKNVSELTAALKAENTLGFSSEDGFISSGLSGISVAVRDHLDFPVAALNLTFKTEQASDDLRERMTKALTTAANQLSRSLGHHD
jgi:DNA-binding IclR family transcriptional regulator